MSKYAPVIVFVYNRLQHTKDLLESLERNPLARESELFIFSDACKEGKNPEKVQEVRSYIHEYEEHSSFKTLTIIEAEVNKGLAKSVIEGTTEILRRYGRVIVLEDDLIVADDFLEFMNRALDYYENKKKIWSVTGYTKQLKALKSYKKDVYLCFRASSWGWGTWLDRWEMIDWNVSDYDTFRKSLFRIVHLNRGGHDMAGMLKRQMQGKLDSWAIRWCYAQDKANTYCICPKETKVVNNGFDGSGMHCDERNPDTRVLSKSKEPVQFIIPKCNFRILFEFWYSFF